MIMIITKLDYPSGPDINTRVFMKGGRRVGIRDLKVLPCWL